MRIISTIDKLARLGFILAGMGIAGLMFSDQSLAASSAQNPQSAGSELGDVYDNSHKNDRMKDLMPKEPPSTTKMDGPLGDDEYDMEKAVLRALKENYNVKAKEASALAAEEGRKSVRGTFGPVLSTSYGYTKLQHKPSFGGQNQDDSYFTWNVTATQNVFSGLRTLSSYQKSVLQKESADADKVNNDITLILDVQTNFLNLLKARENIRSAQDSVERLLSQLKVTRAFYEVGLKPRLDVLQAEVDVANAEDVLLQATQNEETLTARLDTLLNIDIHKTVRYVGTLAQVPFHYGLDECLERAYRQRPDIYIAQKAVEISDKDTAIAGSDFYPQVNAQWSWETQGDSLTADGSNVNSNRFSSWNVGVQADWNVFEWGKTYYSYRQQKQLTSKAKAEQSNLHNEVAFEIKSKLLQLNEAEKRIKVSRKGLAQAREAFRMAEARYQAQVATITDVLDAQSRLTNAESSYTAAMGDYEIAIASLYAAMGEKRPDLSESGSMK